MESYVFTLQRLLAFVAELLVSKVVISSDPVIKMHKDEDLRSPHHAFIYAALIAFSFFG
jgi:hypothetical protein